MSWIHTILILLAAVMAVFWEAAFQGLRHLTGAQVDLLPALMVYTALRGTLAAVILLAVVGGLAFDSLSANPLGISMLPLFGIGLALYVKRDMMVREQLFAQVILGLTVSLAMPLMVLVLLLTSGQSPLLGWGTLWQLLVMCLGGAVATPLFFELFGWLDRALMHGRVVETSFRPDREIRRGR